MSDAADPLSWVEHAEEDYALIRSCLRRKRPLTHSASFHAQQCAEKYMKALLVAKKTKFAKTHDLLVLSALCAKAGILLGMDTTRLQKLSAYAVQARYPATTPRLKRPATRWRSPKQCAGLLESF